MARTADVEWFGDSVDVSIGANYTLRMPAWLPGAVRFYVLRPSTSGLIVTLPTALLIENGAKLVVANHGSHSLTIKDILGTTIATVAVGHCCEVWLLSNALPWGTWLARDTSSALGTSLTHARVPIDVVLTESIATGFNLRDWCYDLGYETDSVPYAVRCTIAAGVTIGRTDSTSDAFTTGSWAAGSTLLLLLESGAMISGRGGAGGHGGDVVGILGQPGEDGGHGLGIGVDTALINYGTIQGGGGGGGGGVRSGSVPGAGGGGGAGYLPGAGGLSGSNSAGVNPTAGTGQGGGVLVGGLAGSSGSFWPASAGGAGGNAGLNGWAGTGATGGLAGSAIRRTAAYTLNKLVAGTITGAEVVV